MAPVPAVTFLPYLGRKSNRMPKITQNSVRFPEGAEEKFSDVLMYFSESLLDIEDEEAILWDLAKNCIAKLGFVDCVVYLLDESRDVMIQKAAYGPKNPKDFEIYEPVERPLGFGIVGHVAASGNAELIHDASKDERYEEDDEFRYSEVCVPIIIDGKVIGIIDCEHPDKNFFSDHHLHMLLTMSSITAIKLKGLRTQMKLIKEQNKASQIQNQLVDLKLKAFGTQMNPHFVFNALNAIQHLIMTDNKQGAFEYLSAFAKLIRFNLNQLGQNSVVLEKEISVLQLYLKLQKLRYENGFEYEVNNNLTDDQKNIKIPSLVVQTLMENLIEEGIVLKRTQQSLKITFSSVKDGVELGVSFRYLPSQEPTEYEPEYRVNMMEWQDQVSLLNQVKEYNIKKEINFIDSETEKGIDIYLRLPSL